MFKVKSMWKEAVVANVNYPGTCLYGVSECIENVLSTVVLRAEIWTQAFRCAEHSAPTFGDML
jgi:hypothetical protein